MPSVEKADPAQSVWNALLRRSGNSAGLISPGLSSSVLVIVSVIAGLQAPVGRHRFAGWNIHDGATIHAHITVHVLVNDGTCVNVWQDGVVTEAETAPGPA